MHHFVRVGYEWFKLYLPVHDDKYTRAGDKKYHSYMTATIYYNNDTKLIKKNFYYCTCRNFFYPH